MMTLEQKIGQLMMIGWQSSSAEDIVDLIKKYHFGNVILFTRNIKSSSELKEICAQIQSAAIKYNGVPAFIAIDQEGGSVRRIYDGVTSVPGNMAVGAASFSIKDAAYQIGKITGQELKQLGINFNLAPVVDINNNPQNPVIAIRSYGDNPEFVSKLASDYARGLQEQGVMGCYKHFIGHGNVHVDSHLELPHLNSSEEEIRQNELVPYKCDKLPDSIMTAHILYKNLDDKFPASISSKIIKNILREELHYKGIVVTDCFEMDALARTFSLEQAAIFAIKAKSDIITVSHTFGRQLIVRNGLIQAVKNNDLSMKIIDESLDRVLKLKNKYCSLDEKEINYEENRKIAEKISRHSITLISGAIPPITDQMVVVGVTNYVNSIAEDKNVENMDIAKTLGEEFNLDYKAIDSKNFNVNEMINFARGKDVILALGDSHLTLVQKVLYSSILQVAKRVLLISLRTPYDILGQEIPYGHLCLYEYTKLSVESLLSILRGSKPQGGLPVNIDDFKSSIQTKSDIKNYLIDNVIKYVDENYAKNLTLEEVANEFLISRGYLCKLFKSKLDINFIDYLNGVRTSKAKKLLTTTPLKIYEISNLVGYKDENYFCKIFKKIVGVTPNYFRNNFNIND